MEETRSRALLRDCSATQIPAGNTVVLPAGTEIDITQTLGGAFTVLALGGLFRVSSNDADALGLSKLDAPTPDAQAEGGTVTEEDVWKILRTCYDPEIPVNIVDLGLVYEMHLEPVASAPNQKRVEVKMSLTAPGCGMGATIAGDAQQKLLDLPGVAQADVQIVWDPPWNPARISPAGRAVLGLDE